MKLETTEPLGSISVLEEADYQAAYESVKLTTVRWKDMEDKSREQLFSLRIEQFLAVLKLRIIIKHGALESVLESDLRLRTAVRDRLVRASSWYVSQYYNLDLKSCTVPQLRNQIKSKATEILAMEAKEVKKNLKNWGVSSVQKLWQYSKKPCPPNEIIAPPPPLNRNHVKQLNSILKKINSLPSPEAVKAWKKGREIWDQKRPDEPTPMFPQFLIKQE